MALESYLRRGVGNDDGSLVPATGTKRALKTDTANTQNAVEVPYIVPRAIEVKPEHVEEVEVNIRVRTSTARSRRRRSGKTAEAACGVVPRQPWGKRRSLVGLGVLGFAVLVIAATLLNPDAVETATKFLIALTQLL